MNTNKGLIPVTKTVTVYPAPKCLKCSEPSTPVFAPTVSPDGTWDSLQVNNGLVMELSGGYGMYVDSEHRAPNFVLCGSCIEEIRSNPDNKWFDDALNEL